MRVRNIDESNLKIVIVTHFHSKSVENLGKNNSSVNIRFVAKHQTSEISLKTSDLMLKHQKWQHWLLRMLCLVFVFRI